jgi:alpha,alpha-trehalose phosphorylase
VKHDAFDVDPWRIRETRLALDVLAHTESVFALSNGHIGMRGNLDEGEPHGLPGMYLNSMFELRPLPYAEAGYGYPESGQSMVNITNGKIIRLLVDDEPFDVRYGTLRAHERVLDLRAGTLVRTAHWTSPAMGCGRSPCTARTRAGSSSAPRWTTRSTGRRARAPTWSRFPTSAA